MSDARLAAIDIGSNTIHMIVVQRQKGNRLKHILDKSRLMELGMLEDRKGSLPDYAQASIRRTLESFIRQVREADASEILVGATAALRDDPQRNRIAARLSRAVGLPVHIISKQREIELGFLAARHDLRPTGKQIFVDSGGASTEITLCEGRSARQTASLPVGASKLSVLLEGDASRTLELCPAYGAHPRCDAKSPISPERSHSGFRRRDGSSRLRCRGDPSAPAYARGAGARIAAPPQETCQENRQKI